MKIIRTLGNRGTLLKGTTRNITNQEGGFFDFFRPLLSAGLPLMKNVFTTLAKSVLVPLGLTATALTTNAAIQNKIFGLATTDRIISKKEMKKKMMKIVKSHEELGLQIKDVNEKIKNGAKKQKGGFLGMLLCTLAASALGNIFGGKPKIHGREVIRAGDGIIQAGDSQDF